MAPSPPPRHVRWRPNRCSPPSPFNPGTRRRTTQRTAAPAMRQRPRPATGARAARPRRAAPRPASRPPLAAPQRQAWPQPSPARSRPSRPRCARPRARACGRCWSRCAAPGSGLQTQGVARQRLRPGEAPLLAAGGEGLLERGRGQPAWASCSLPKPRVASLAAVGSGPMASREAFNALPAGDPFRAFVLERWDHHLQGREAGALRAGPVPDPVRRPAAREPIRVRHRRLHRPGGRAVGSAGAARDRAQVDLEVDPRAARRRWAGPRLPPRGAARLRPGRGLRRRPAAVRPAPVPGGRAGGLRAGGDRLGPGRRAGPGDHLQPGQEPGRAGQAGGPPGGERGRLRPAVGARTRSRPCFPG